MATSGPHSADPQTRGLPPAPLAAQNTATVSLSLVSASPLSERNTVIASGLGDGYRASFVIGNPTDDGALNSLCKKQRVFLGAAHIENVESLKIAILAT